MIPYASWTGTKTTLSALQGAGWRLLMSPDTLDRCINKARPYWPDQTPAPFALDNGAWGCFQRQQPFDEDRFSWALARIGEEADWIVMPDSVGDPQKTMQMAARWWPELIRYSNPLLAVQDGMTEDDVRPWIARGFGIFLGGSTDWKLETMKRWGRLARQTGAYFHVGRVNTAKRIKMCGLCGADSFDGTSATRFSKTIPMLTNANRQLPLLEVI